MSAIDNEGFNGFPVPIGTVMMWANQAAKPNLVVDLESFSGFLVCDGRDLLISEYPDLYRVFGGVSTPYDAYGVAPPAGSFKLPNLPDPNGAGILPFLIGAGTAGFIINPTAQQPIGTAEITLTASQLPTFPLDYPAPTAPDYTCNGEYYCFSSVDGSKIGTNVYTNSNTLTRNPDGNLFLRDDVGYSSVGGIGNDAIAPQFAYTQPAQTPVDITVSVVQNTFTAASFNIVPIIKASVKTNWAYA